MTNWMLEVENVEDVACRIEDMEAMGRSRSLVQRGWRGDKSTKTETMALSSAGRRRKAVQTTR